MKALLAFLGVLALSTTLGLVVAQDRPEKAAAAPTDARPPAESDRASDRQAIADLVETFVKAYNAKDAKTLGDLFTPDAEIEDEDGDVTRGRAAIVARFTNTLAEGKGGKLSIDTESVRFLGGNLAIEEGTASLSTGTESSPSTNRYSVIYAKQDGHWLQARIRDEPNEEVSPHERLRELEWMLGEWVNESDEGIVRTSCKWSDGGNFLLREFDVKVEGRIALTGSQRIGWDPQKEQFRVWVFDDGGGFADGLLARSGDHWVVKGSGVRSDGKSVSFTNVITVLGKDRLRWETSDRIVGGLAIAQSDRFYLVRPAPLPAK